MMAIDSPNVYVSRFKRLFLNTRGKNVRPERRMFSGSAAYKGSENLNDEFWPGEDIFDFLISYPPEMR